MELLQHNQKNLLCVVYCILCIKMTPEGCAPILATVTKMYPGGSNPCDCHKSDPAPNLLFLLCKNWKLNSKSGSSDLPPHEGVGRQLLGRQLKIIIFRPSEPQNLLYNLSGVLCGSSWPGALFSEAKGSLRRRQGLSSARPGALFNEARGSLQRRQGLSSATPGALFSDAKGSLRRRQGLSSARPGALFSDARASLQRGQGLSSARCCRENVVVELLSRSCCRGALVEELLSNSCCREVFVEMLLSRSCCRGALVEELLSL